MHLLTHGWRVVSNCLILNTKSVSSPTQVRLKSDRCPTAVGDDPELGRRWAGSDTWRVAFQGVEKIFLPTKENFSYLCILI